MIKDLISTSTREKNKFFKFFPFPSFASEEAT